MSKEDFEPNSISSKQETEPLDFWDTHCTFSDGSDTERELIKPKCNKYLKKKLKKYRKRKNGEEDPEVLEVSLSLNEALSFSLDNPNNNNEVDVEDFERLPNYLMKMVRHNKNSQKTVKAVIKSNSKEFDKSQDNVVDQKQESKQKNAFQLMMNSRNKSIGTNSPGKEKNDDDDDFKEDVVFQKKATKAKRNLLLQKMAEAKGALKNKEVEEIQEEIISQKMQKRAKRLKEMITKESKNVKKNNDKTKKREEKLDKAEEAARGNKNKLRNKIIDVDVQVCPEPVIVSPPKKKISKEDEEFLNKLSPSIKKKENMLCYFKKVEKETESQPVVDINSENIKVKDSSIIKVKLENKNKKSLKKRKLSLKTTMIEEDSKDCNENNFNSPNIVTPLESPKVTDIVLAAAETGSRKRKRTTKLDDNKHSEEAPNVEATEGRPRRHVRKPVKYAEDVNLSSSDDELLIITPKKKKHTDKEFINGPNRDKEPSGVNNKIKLKNKETAKKVMKLEPKGKLAPIFMPKPQIDPAVLEAKQKFLQSGVPERLKKIAAQQIVQINNSICFHSVVHVRQESVVPSNEVKFDFYESSNDSSKPDDSRADDNECGDKLFKKLLSLQKSPPEATHLVTPNTKDTKEILQSIKDMYPEFPVYRTYRLLKNKSKGDHTDVNFVEFDNSNEALNATLDTTTEDPKSLCWVDKYRATSTKQIIGNFESMKELRKWLASWKESQVCSKNGQGNDSDSDFYNSDTDSRDNAAMANNLVIVTGPAGSGKTSGVHATAAELAFKVIEVNVGSRRTGKILLQDLQEATQSHKVNRAKGGSADSSQNILDCLPKSQSNKQKKTKQKSNSQNSQPLFSQEDSRTGMSLILIDDADIVFEQDDGFISGILQLVQCSKRPVVIVTSSLTSQNMQRFLNCENIIKLRPLLPRMLGTWLDLVCLAELGAGWPGAGSALLDYCRGDIRKAINSLNFYAFSEVHKRNIATEEDENSDDDQKIINCDETSNMSWAGGDSEEIKFTAASQDPLLTKDIIANFKDSSDLVDKWWSLHDVFSVRNDTKDSKRLEDITTAVDALSLSDLCSKRRTKSVVCPSPWYTTESDSVTERDSVECVNNFYDACSEITMHLVERTIANNECNASRKANKDTTSYMLQRDSDKTISRHKLLTESLVPCSVLDRKAIALDYWPTFRAICRAEKVKTDCNLKRNNRFTHYLKTTKIGAKSEVFSKLGDVLNI